VDFSFDDEQQAIHDLARQIFADRASDERLAELEASGEWFDRGLWAELAKANLTALAIPEDLGGAGYGLLEACLVLQEAGRHLAPVPLLPTLVLGALPVAAFGSAAQREHWLGPVAHGEGVLTAALEEVGEGDPARPNLTAQRDGEAWRLDGEKVCVPGAELAGGILVPARTGEEAVGVFLLDPAVSGVAIQRQVTTNREPHGRLELAGARVPADAVLGDPESGAAIVEWTAERASVALCAVQVGVAEEALRRTSEYTTQRRQFGRPVAAFQGVALRAADAFVDVEAMRATLWQAAWRLTEGLPADREVAAARWWACLGGQRVVHAAQHLHGGIGSDIDYPIHRFLLWSKQLELSLGGANRQLARLGSLLAAGPRPEEPA
jgi:alkylation response protein AidB-like acyl-CoA dehydrogenase